MEEKIQTMNSTIELANSTIESARTITKNSIYICVLNSAIEEVLKLNPELNYGEVDTTEVRNLVENECEKIYPLETESLSGIWFNNLISLIEAEIAPI